jgi:hypothetical protein
VGVEDDVEIVIVIDLYLIITLVLCGYDVILDQLEEAREVKCYLNTGITVYKVGSLILQH